MIKEHLQLLRLVAICAAFTALPGAAQEPSGVCPDLPATTLADLASEDPWATLMAANDIKGLLDAYFEAPDGSKLDAVGKGIAMKGVEIAVEAVLGEAGSIAMTIIVKGGEIFMNGVPMAVEEAGRLQIEAFLCGGVSGGERLPVGDFFSLAGAQAIAPGLTCENFGDWIDTPAKFKRLRDLFKGFYSRSLLQFAGRQNRAEYQNILDAEWKVIERTWAIRMAARRLAKLELDLKRLAADNLRSCQIQPPAAAASGEAAPPAPGSDTTDPALLPEPPAPPLGHLVLVQTNVMPYAAFPPYGVVSAAPQRTSYTDYYGESVCSWTTPPKTVGLEPFEIEFSVKVQSIKPHSYNLTFTVKSGFIKLNNQPNELAAQGIKGGADQKSSRIVLQATSLESNLQGNKTYLQFGGCGGNVDYVYEFRKP